MMGPSISYFTGLGIHTLKEAGSGVKDFLEFLGNLGTEHQRLSNQFNNRIDKREQEDQSNARKVTNKFWQLSGRVVFWSLIFIFGFSLIAGGFSHFANFIKEPRGWVLSPFLGSYHYALHEFSHTFVIAPWMEDVISGIVGFFSGHIARR